MDEINVLKTSDAQKYLGVGKNEFKKLVDDGKLKFFLTTGGFKKFPRKYLDEFIEQQCIKEE